MIIIKHSDHWSVPLLQEDWEFQIVVMDMSLACASRKQGFFIILMNCHILASDTPILGDTYGFSSPFKLGKITNRITAKLSNNKEWSNQNLYWNKAVVRWRTLVLTTSFGPIPVLESDDWTACRNNHRVMVCTYQTLTMTNSSSLFSYKIRL